MRIRGGLAKKGRLAPFARRIEDAAAVLSTRAARASRESG
jgi:hypothetical protein